MYFCKTFGSEFPETKTWFWHQNSQPLQTKDIIKWTLVIKRYSYYKSALFNWTKSELNNTEIDNAKNIDMVIAMYDLIEYNDSFSKKNLDVYGNVTQMSQPIV